MSQISDLPKNKLAIFAELREQFIQEQRLIDDKRREQASQEEEKARERQQNIADMKKQKKDDMKDNISKPVDQWVDCKEKYDKILEEFKITGKRFTDSQFKADQASLGPNCLNRGVE